MPDNGDQKRSLAELAEVVQEYHQAIEEEFDAISAGDDAALSMQVKKKLAAKVLAFTDVITEIAEHGETDSVRLSAAKFGLNFVFGGKVGEGEDDPMQKLIKSLTRTNDDEDQ